MRESLFETLVGFCVVAVAAVFLVFSLGQKAEGSTAGSYTLKASFNRVDGISTGSDVRLAGVKIGVVSDVSIKNYRAQVAFTVPQDIQIPDDSTAQITSDGLLGGAYLSLVVGGSPDYLPAGGEIEYTRGSLDLLSVLAQFASGGGSSSEDEGATATDGE